MVILERGFTELFWESQMSKAIETTRTRLARWYTAFRQSRYYSRFE